MRRRLSTFFVLVSLLICIVTVGLWAQSYHIALGVDFVQSSDISPPPFATLGTQPNGYEYLVGMDQGQAVYSRSAAIVTLPRWHLIHYHPLHGSGWFPRFAFRADFIMFPLSKS